MGRENKYYQRSWVKIRTWKDHSPITIVKQTQLGEISLIYYQSSKVWDIKLNSKPPSLQPSLLPGINISPNILYLLLLSDAGGLRMGFAVSLSHVSNPPSHSWRGRTPHTFPSLQRGVPAMGDSPPQSSAISVLPTGCSCSQTAPAWVPPLGYSPSGTHSGVDPPWGHQSCQQICSSVDFIPHGARTLLKPGLPKGLRTSFRPSPAPVWGPPWTAGGSLHSCGPLGAAGSHPASLWAASQTAGKSLLQCLEHLLPSALTSGSTYLKL